MKKTDAATSASSGQAASTQRLGSGQAASTQRLGSGQAASTQRLGSGQASSTQGSGRDASDEAREYLAEVEQFMVELRRWRELKLIAEQGRRMIEVALRAMKDHRP